MSRPTTVRGGPRRSPVRMASRRSSPGSTVAARPRASRRASRPRKTRSRGPPRRPWPGRAGRSPHRARRADLAVPQQPDRRDPPPSPRPGWHRQPEGRDRPGREPAARARPRRRGMPQASSVSTTSGRVVVAARDQDQDVLRGGRPHRAARGPARASKAATPSPSGAPEDGQAVGVVPGSGIVAEQVAASIRRRPAAGVDSSGYGRPRRTPVQEPVADRLAAPA